MSNRDPLYGRTTASGVDPFEASPRPGNTDDTGDTKDKAKDAANTAKDKGQQAMDDVNQKGQQAKQKAGEGTGKAHDKADQGMDKASSGLDQAADKLREKGGQQGGSMGSTATMAADKLESASGYLREKDTDQIVDDLEALIRRKPTESLLVAAGVGFVLSRIFR